MAFVYCDSFDHYTTALQKWTGGTSGAVIGASGGRRGTNGLSFTTGSGNFINNVVQDMPTASGSTVIAGFAFEFSPNAFQNLNVFSIFNVGTEQFHVNFNTDRSVSLVNGSGTTIATSAAGVAVATGGFFEIKVTIANAGGAYEARINGATLFSGTGDTQNSGAAVWTRVKFGWNLTTFTSTTINRYDDFYLLDGTGSAPMNDFLGDIRVDALFPTAEGVYSDWTPSTGTDNSATVDETPPNSDTDYNSTTGVGNKDSFVIPDLPVTGASIFGVQTHYFAEKTDGGFANAAALVRSGGTDFLGVDTALQTNTYAYVIDPWGLDPNTSAQWTEANFNAMQAGYKRTL